MWFLVVFNTQRVRNSKRRNNSYSSRVNCADELRTQGAYRTLVHNQYGKLEVQENIHDIKTFCRTSVSEGLHLKKDIDHHIETDATSKQVFRRLYQLSAAEQLAGKECIEKHLKAVKSDLANHPNGHRCFFQRKGGNITQCGRLSRS